MQNLNNFQESHRSDVDGLRAIAVLSVVAFHAFPLVMPGGFAGVDIFFVISGFLITSILLKEIGQDNFLSVLLNFYSRRIRRLFPAFLLVLGVCYVLGWNTLLPMEYKQLGKHIVASAQFIPNFVYKSESSYFDNAADTKPLLHLWSLGIEEQFYLLWPLLLWLSWRFRLSYFIIIGLLLIFSFLLNVRVYHHDITADFYLPQARFWELLFGALLAFITLTKGQDFYTTIIKNGLSFLGAILLVIGFYCINKHLIFPGWWGLLITIGTFLIISAGPSAFLNRKFFSHPILVWIGVISYPFYLWHWPVLVFARLTSDSPLSIIFRLILIACSMVLAYFTYRLIENPLRFGRYAKMKVLVLLVLMIALGSVGQLTYKKEGLRFRFPEIIYNLVNYPMTPPGWRVGSCFLDWDQDYKGFNACPSTIDKNKKTLFLWGDSYAAHLYPGISHSFEGFNIIQRTASRCLPLMGIHPKDRPYCNKINEITFDLLKKTRPEVLILAGAWPEYTPEGFEDHFNLVEQLQDAINDFKKLGINKIILIGPVPKWENALIKQLYLHYVTDKMHRIFLKSNTTYKIPDRMTYGLREEFFAADRLMRDVAAKTGILYISPKDILCNEEGCLTFFEGKLVTRDQSHLTDDGSRYLVSQFSKLV